MAKKTTLFIGLDATAGTGDAFRSAMGNYWVGSAHGNPPPATAKKIEVMYGEQLTTKSAQAPFFNVKQKIEILGIPSFFPTEKDWKDYMAAMFPIGVTQTDMVFDLESLIPKYEDTLGGTGALYGDVEFVYNFYVRPYEFILTLPQVSEKVLPNIYAEISNDANNVDPFFENLITGFGVAPKQEVKMTNLMKNDDADARELLYTNISKKIANTGGGNRQLLASRFSNVIFPIDNIDMLKEIESHVNIFPMVSKIEFRTDSRTEFAQILKDSQLSTSFLKYISFIDRAADETTDAGAQLANLKMFKGKGTSFQTVVGNTSANQSPGLRPDLGGAGNRFGSNTIKSTGAPNIVEGSELPEIDVLEWWDGFLHNTIDFGSSSKSEVFMGNQDASVQIARNIQSSFSKILSLLIFSGKLQSLIKSKMRSYAQITNGEKCYTETVAYRVAKYSTDSGQGVPIQNFWFPNSNEIDVIKYFDTQVKYDKAYKYIIYAYELVIGSEYEYTNLEIVPDIITADLNTPGATEAVLNIFEDVFGFSVEGSVSSTSDSAPTLENAEVVVASETATVASPSNFYTAAVYGNNSGTPSFFPAPNQIEGSGVGAPSNTVMAPFGSVNLNVDILPNYEVSLTNQIQVRDYDQLRANVSVTVRPNVKIMERQIYERTGRIMDNPPVFPDTFIYPL